MKSILSIFRKKRIDPVPQPIPEPAPDYTLLFDEPKSTKFVLKRMDEAVCGEFHGTDDGAFMLVFLMENQNAEDRLCRGINFTKFQFIY